MGRGELQLGRESQHFRGVCEKSGAGGISPAAYQYRPHSVSDADIQDFLTKALRQSHQDEERFHSEALARLTAEHAQLQNRLDTMYVDKLDGKISESFYERKAAEWRAEQDRIAEAIRDHRRADRSYADTGVRLLELASGAHDAFMSQGSDEKRKLLQLLVSNSSWKHGRLALGSMHPSIRS